MGNYLIVALGAGIGGAMRHGVNVTAARLLGTGFPFGTLTVNVLGSFMMGLLTQVFLARPGIGQEWRLLITTGMLGGFTTFSTFSLDTAVLMERGAPATAAGYVALSLLASVGGLFLGLRVGG
ncbi:fluoride efflux transporter CrcB [Amaricoccus solimangrovi]|uniref:Fluoride-specific ion channel FluC n=1 Tax=Amaricoccus solimangrovi TaxID=2589815 RepID=A0A501WPC3_9RHOB|nr:fluoride efflux transporter CrcB [Amaricoccus solimangrovi]TPE50190.1 fluoride efflux transporter CrcB [Amaricoccus solimangrovi]